MLVPPFHRRTWAHCQAQQAEPALASPRAFRATCCYQSPRAHRPQYAGIPQVMFSFSVCIYLVRLVRRQPSASTTISGHELGAGFGTSSVAGGVWGLRGGLRRGVLCPHRAVTGRVADSQPADLPGRSRISRHQSLTAAVACAASARLHRPSGTSCFCWDRIGSSPVGPSNGRF